MKKLLILMITALVVLVMSACDELEESTEENAEEVKAANQADKETNANGDNNEEVEMIKSGEPAEVADGTFTVNSVEEANEIQSDNEFIDDVETSGKFVILDVEVKNGKDESINIDSSYFKFITNENKEYDPSSDVDAMMALGDKASYFFLEQINPDLSTDGKIVFEVGEDVVVDESTLQAQTGFFGTETIEVSLTE